MGGLSCVVTGQIFSTEIQAQGVVLTRMIPVSFWRCGDRIGDSKKAVGVAAAFWYGRILNRSIARGRYLPTSTRS